MFFNLENPRTTIKILNFYKFFPIRLFNAVLHMIRKKIKQNVHKTTNRFFELFEHGLEPVFELIDSLSASKYCE